MCVVGPTSACLSSQQSSKRSPGNSSISHSFAGTMLSSAPAEPEKLLHHCLSVEGFWCLGLLFLQLPRVCESHGQFNVTLKQQRNHL